MQKRRTDKKDRTPAPMTDDELNVLLHWLVAIHKWGKSV